MIEVTFQPPCTQAERQKKYLQAPNVVSTNSNTEVVTGVAILKIMSRIFLFKVKTNVRKEKGNDCKVIISGKQVYKNLLSKKRPVNSGRVEERGGGGRGDGEREVSVGYQRQMPTDRGVQLKY